LRSSLLRHKFTGRATNQKLKNSLGKKKPYNQKILGITPTINAAYSSDREMCFALPKFRQNTETIYGNKSSKIRLILTSSEVKTRFETEYYILPLIKAKYGNEFRI
jgi:hypothetical protein